jgi:hypothetical protein
MSLLIVLKMRNMIVGGALTLNDACEWAGDFDGSICVNLGAWRTSQRVIE